MTRELVESTRFARALRRYAGRDERRRNCISETLLLMGRDVFQSRLKTHPLTGNLKNYFACSCGYDCRIVFTIEKLPAGREAIVLHDIGTHDEVY